MASWSIAPLQPQDLDDFVDCQFLSFVGNPLHDVPYPTQAAAVEMHRKAMTDDSELQEGNDVLYLKAVDDDSGKIIGGIKFLSYAGEDVKETSPYAAGIKKDLQGSDGDKYRQYVLNEFLGRRVRAINGRHALIDLLFVHPEHFRRGIGGELVGRTCKLADERGLKAIVEASPIGKRTYEICGYRSKEQVIIPPGVWTGKPEQMYFWMEREPLSNTRS